jgi:hypothetical protein
MICKNCNIDKPLSEFYEYKSRHHKKTGKTYYKKDCKDCSLKKHKPSKEARRFADFNGNLKRRGIEVTLTREQFLEFWGKPCIYCGNDTPTVNLDRVNSDKGYSMDNVVPCCLSCNMGKGTQTAEQYIDHCNKVVDHSSI